MLDIKKFMHHLYLSIFLSITPLYSVVFIDVDNFEFKIANRRGIRFTVFDIKSQKYDKICYWNNFSTEQSKEEEKWSEDELDVKGIKLKFSNVGSIKFVGDELAYNQCLIRTCGSIINKDDKVLQKPRQDIRNIYPAINLLESGDYLYKFLEKFSSNTTTPIFLVNVIPDNELQRDFSKITVKSIPIDKESKGENSIERGKLGESATEITMLGSGYTRLSSQNTSNQGLDGIWVDSKTDTKFLFFSESKCHKKSTTAKTFMENYFDDSRIMNRLENTTSVETREFVMKFMNEKPDKVFKFIHRLKENGEMQICIEKFDLHHYQFSKLFKNLSIVSSDEDKTKVIEALAFRMGIAPKKMITLILDSTVSNVEWKMAPLNESKIMDDLTVRTSNMRISSPQQSTSSTASTLNIHKENLTNSTSALKDFFIDFSYEKLIFLIKLLNNSENKLSHVKIGYERIAKYAKLNGQSQRKKISKLVKNKSDEGLEELSKNLWDGLKKNIAVICLENKISEEDLSKVILEKNF